MNAEKSSFSTAPCLESARKNYIILISIDFLRSVTMVIPHLADWPHYFPWQRRDKMGRTDVFEKAIEIT